MQEYQNHCVQISDIPVLGEMTLIIEPISDKEWFKHDGSRLKLFEEKGQDEENRETSEHFQTKN